MDGLVTRIVRYVSPQNRDKKKGNRGPTAPLWAQIVSPSLAD